MLDLFKKQQPEIPKPPMPPPGAVDRFGEIKEALNTIYTSIEEHGKTLSVLEQNQRLIYDTVKGSGNNAVVLNDEELKLVPEKDKDFYMSMKQENPKMAKVMLDGFRSKDGK